MYLNWKQQIPFVLNKLKNTDWEWEQTEKQKHKQTENKNIDWEWETNTGTKNTKQKNSEIQIEFCKRILDPYQTTPDQPGTSMKEIP